MILDWFRTGEEPLVSNGQPAFTGQQEPGLVQRVLVETATGKSKQTKPTSTATVAQVVRYEISM